MFIFRRNDVHEAFAAQVELLTKQEQGVALAYRDAAFAAASDPAKQTTADEAYASVLAHGEKLKRARAALADVAASRLPSLVI